MAPDEPMITALDQMPLVNRLLLPETMDEIPHHRGMVPPTGSRLTHLPVTPEKTAPPSLGITQGKTHRLGTGAGNRQSKPG